MVLTGYLTGPSSIQLSRSHCHFLGDSIIIYSEPVLLGGLRYVSSRLPRSGGKSVIANAFSRQNSPMPTIGIPALLRERLLGGIGFEPLRRSEEHNLSCL